MGPDALNFNFNGPSTISVGPHAGLLKKNGPTAALVKNGEIRHPCKKWGKYPDDTKMGPDAVNFKIDGPTSS